jgi:predicted LPLAT superfamily acyltransferase
MTAYIAALAAVALVGYFALVLLDRRRADHRYAKRMQNVGR